MPIPRNWHLSHALLLLIRAVDLPEELDVILEGLRLQRPKGEPEETQVGRRVTRVQVLVLRVRTCHVGVHAAQNRSATLEEALVKLVAREALGQFDPVVKAT